ncbi:hypothetical protein I4U23_004989 [Adineta vaga]|nr:hypothetical protein I4U23_004989 [Adineta vaga]
MASRLMKSASEISTHFRCDHCGITIDDVAWRQCKICKIFDLCHTCGQLQYNQLLDSVRNDHLQRHIELSEHGLITNDCIEWILVEQAEINGQTVRNKIREEHLKRIEKEKKICNDYDMSIVMDQLEKMKNLSSTKDIEWHGLDSLLARYHLEAHERNIRVLSLDGGGVRGYMPIKIISQLVTQKYLSLNEPLDSRNIEHKKLFEKAQIKFTEQFDYFVGTSTGGLIAFCLAMNYSILEMMDIYAKYSHYFWRNYLGPIIYSKYNPARIHQKIDDIINSLTFKDGTKLSAENATLLDIRNILNPEKIITNEEAQLRAASNHGNLLEFVDDIKNIDDNVHRITENYSFHRINREKVLLITSYNTTTNSIMIFNTSYSQHWGYRIADVLKATMAAPTYFPPMEISTGKKVNDQFEKDGPSELFIDGGVFANDPELSALWAIRMQWKKPANYHLLSIGTGCYNTTLSPSTWGGYLGWIMNKGYLVNTLMDAPRSFIEIIGSNLAKFSNIRRMKLNYKMTKSMALDDGKFVGIFDKEWEVLKTEEDYKAFVYFYENYIVQGNRY